MASLMQYFASSVHPLTMVAGIKIAKSLVFLAFVKYDLWPESLVAYGIIKANPILKLLYTGEKWIYKNADAIVMTWKGGKITLLKRVI